MRVWDFLKETFSEWSEDRAPRMGAALVFGATGAFVELQDALNTIWKVQPRPRGLLRMLKDRFLSFTLVVGIGFLLLVSLVISAALAALGSVTARYVSPSLLHGVNFLVSFGLLTA